MWWLLVIIGGQVLCTIISVLQDICNLIRLPLSCSCVMPRYYLSFKYIPKCNIMGNTWASN